jgi:Neuraminidase (sialidase)
MRSRRAFLRDVVLAQTAVALGLGDRLSAAAETVKAKPDVVVHDGTYPGWPWVAAAPDGVLYCVFREGTVHDYSANGRVMLCQSTDRGRTWSRARVIVDAPEVDDRNVAIAVLPGKDLLITYNTYTKSRESLARWARSSDGGKTWSKPRPIGEPNTRTRAAVVPLADGTLVLPYYVAPGNGALAALSKDGETWKTVRVPDTDGFVGDEWDVLEVEPGRLIGILRNSHPKTDGTFWKTESRDGGKTWSAPKRTNVQSQRHPSPAQITRQGKTPTIIYADRRMVSVAAVRTRDPEFLRWDVDNRLACYQYSADGSAIADASYPVSVAVGPRERLIVDYEIRKDSRRIAGYFVTFPGSW